MHSRCHYSMKHPTANDRDVILPDNYQHSSLTQFRATAGAASPICLYSGSTCLSFDVLLNVHLSTILVINQLNAQNLVL